MMRRATKPRFARALPYAALVWSGLTATALAQGTAEQREACAPDAVRLCQDTIPDETRTAACMKRHLAELTPRCRTVFLEATGGAPDATEPRPRRAARAAPRDEYDEPRPKPRRYRGPDADEELYSRGEREPYYGPDEPGVREYRYLAPGGEEAQAPETDDRERARAEIGRLCEQGAMDADTCATTNRALGR